MCDKGFRLNYGLPYSNKMTLFPPKLSMSKRRHRIGWKCRQTRQSNDIDCDVFSMSFPRIPPMKSTCIYIEQTFIRRHAETSCRQPKPHQITTMCTLSLYNVLSASKTSTHCHNTVEPVLKWYSWAQFFLLI